MDRLNELLGEKCVTKKMQNIKMPIEKTKKNGHEVEFDNLFKLVDGKIHMIRKILNKFDDKWFQKTAKVSSK